MKLLLKILFFLLAIFCTNISEAKIFVLDDRISETVFSNAFNSENSKVVLQRELSGSDFTNTCKSERDLVDYRNLAISSKADAAEEGVHSFGSLKNMSGSLDDAAALARNQPYGPNTNIFRRLPNSAQDAQALTEAQAGMGRNLNIKLGDPTYQGWEKWHHSVGPKGSKSVVHYLRNPQTGFLTDFKFK